ncbi:MAG TPA: formate dehydrogenase accessory sulfurtransferase FdhD [Spirochaetota bacterium]|nr:formate dehydrogenase accessory sulfurtransferase FdhD [Spirochaetota bacterium]
MDNRLTVTPIVRYTKGAFHNEDDVVIAEEPLSVLINGEPAFFCMRLPGNDTELALGLCYGEGIVSSYEDVRSVEISERDIKTLDLIVERKNSGQKIRGKIIRSSTGSPFHEEYAKILEQGGVLRNSLRLTAQQLFSLHEDFHGRQILFNETGGTHAAAVYGYDGELLAFAEDVGRHNAFDKCTGRILMDGTNESAAVAVLSSRLSYEMASKAIRLGVEVLTGVSAPTSLAVHLAEKNSMTLIGFVRGDRCNVYSMPDRIVR